MNLALGRKAQALLLAALYLFLYAPIAWVIYVAFQENSIWPFPPDASLRNFESLVELDDYWKGLKNSLAIGVGTGLLASLLATAGAIAVLRYRVRERAIVAGIYLAPLFIAHILIGISSLMFNRSILGLPGNLASAFLANASYASAFAFLVVLAQLARYDWRLDEAAVGVG
ncbi:MAG: ABC transporter permease, partial [Parvibaculaceae bacterium]